MKDVSRELYFTWLRGKLPSIDRLLKKIISEEFEKRGKPFKSAYKASDSMATQVGTFRSSKARDIDYDIAELDIAYASWYMPRRVADMLLPMYEILVRNKDEERIEFYDIGCGVGSCYVALLLALEYCRETGLIFPSVTYYPIDITDNMLAMMNIFIENIDLPVQRSIHIAPFAKSSWNSFEKKSKSGYSILVGGYLIQIEDKADTDFANSFCKMIDESRFDEVLLSTSEEKAVVLETIRFILSKEFYVEFERDHNKINKILLSKSCLRQLRMDWHDEWKKDEVNFAAKGLWLEPVTWQSIDENKTSFYHAYFNIPF